MATGGARWGLNGGRLSGVVKAPSRVSTTLAPTEATALLRLCSDVTKISILASYRQKLLPRCMNKGTAAAAVSDAINIGTP